jgi:opacity protein-like surface antigen
MVMVTEVLIGQSQNKVQSNMRSDFSDESYSSTLESDSYSFRLGVKLTDSFTFELSKHDHGEVINNFTISTPTMAAATPSGTSVLHSDTTSEANIPIKLSSVRLGVKGEIELSTGLFINTSLGIAHWKYNDYSPQYLTRLGPSYSSGQSGNDLYYSLGAKYAFTESFHVGFEYSLLKINEKTAINDEFSGSFKHDVNDLSFVLGWSF